MSEQRTLSLGFREFQPSDYEWLVEIYNANYPDYPISVAERRNRDVSLDRTKYLLKRYECVDQEHDKIVGFGELINVPDMYHPRKFMAGILVDPEQQCRGISPADPGRYALRSGVHASELRRLGHLFAQEPSAPP